jgi:hypothetical protein
MISKSLERISSFRKDSEFFEEEITERDKLADQ